MNAAPLVYRVFDADDRLIYIGATKNLKDRMGNHRSLKWWHSLVARVETERHVDMESAFAAEAAAIAAERPAFNRTHTGHYYTPMPLTAADLDVCRAWINEDPLRAPRLPMALRRPQFKGLLQ